MKQRKCPICKKVFDVRFLDLHITNKARQERREKLDKPHNDYVYKINNEEIK